jgi:hypothetical protein
MASHFTAASLVSELSAFDFCLYRQGQVVRFYLFIFNEQIDNMNINMQFQWRYQPVLDIYLVYTDNFFPGSWVSKNRALGLR